VDLWLLRRKESKRVAWLSITHNFLIVSNWLKVLLEMVADVKSPTAWVDREVADCEFKDERLGKRFRKLLEQLSDGTGESIPMACQDWANTGACQGSCRSFYAASADLISDCNTAFTTDSRSGLSVTAATGVQLRV